MVEARVDRGVRAASGPRPAARWLPSPGALFRPRAPSKRERQPMPCTAPSRPSHLAILSLVLAGSTAVRAAVVPLLVEPPSGSLSGGFEVRIGGIGPVAGVTGILFGEAPSSAVSILDPLTLGVTVPPGRVPASAVDITVVIGETRLLLPLGFRYVNDPPIARASPSGSGYTVRQGETLVLDGSASSDPNGGAGDRI